MIFLLQFYVYLRGKQPKVKMKESVFAVFLRLFKSLDVLISLNDTHCDFVPVLRKLNKL